MSAGIELDEQIRRYRPLGDTMTERQLPYIDTDIQTLHSMGYAQEMQRRMSSFSNYAISLSIICILAGGITSFHVGLCSVGGASIGLCWPLMSFVALAFAATMAQVASAFPTAGGLYHWSSILGGRGWGWATAWFNLAGLITVMAAVNQATFQFMLGAFAPKFGFSPETVSHWLGSLNNASIAHELFGNGDRAAWPILIAQIIAVSMITFSQAFFNDRGIRLTTYLTDMSGYLILIVSIVLTISMFAGAENHDFSRLITFTNYSGLPEDAEVWPRTENMAWLFALGILLPAYTIIGFDGSAHTSEETKGASMAVPRGIIRAVAVSAIVGWLMLIAMVIAIPDMNTAVNQGSNVFFWLIDQVLPNWLNVALLAGITVTQYCCGLAMITSASRVIYAFSRDGGMPFSDVLSSVSPVYRTPRVAVWLSAILAVAFTLLVPYITITAVGVIFLYVSYVMPTVASVFSHGRTWTKMGPWDMGLWYKPLAVICVISSVCLVVIGIQPPNEIAAYIIPAFVVILLVYWFAYKRNVFAGPPSGKITEKRHIEILEIERALNEGHG